VAREISLSRGKVAIVDDADYEWLSCWKWHYNAATGYAARRYNEAALMYHGPKAILNQLEEAS
jgi:hypothetical protein